ncbi:slipin family protein [Sulfolobus sp. B1]|uniref:slipin family protein n=1 Tax=Sulfolobaceae TaxID=118883 RepID=UPI000845EF8F|nr:MULTISPECIES: slipin family protein [unclassified Sulfolobus]TRM76065.1 slipin family protein [Sulfolobus sp. E5]TRM81089.1 slipin family protein [Sulfolobus sp. D5]TRM93713.1 slipin family protein [Sulfolobus sp. A20-N-G8]TRN00909.1 slipin family protein [Sulfolobus sp. E1]TRM96804.1 slipin family protein [Sulfolobus sp. B1]
MAIDIGLIVGLVFLFIIIIIFVAMSFRVVREWERAVVLRLGRFLRIKGPGIIFLIPFVDRPLVVDLRVNTVEVPPQTILTKDNVTVSVDAVVYYKVIDPQKAVISVYNYNVAVLNLAQTSLRDIVGQMELDELLSKREEINRKLQEILDISTEGWGIKVTAVTIRDIRLSQDLLTAMAKQAEAERLRRAKVILSEGERQAASILADASTYYRDNPTALQLRFLETLSDISQRGGLIIVVPAGNEIYPTLGTSVALSTLSKKIQADTKQS